MVDGPEVHADGEIWLQTLWQLRDTLGQSTTQGLITRAMELSPPEPTFLDMRNSILQADLIGNAGANQDAIWAVFAERGMGYFASAFDGNDIEPARGLQPAARLCRRSVRSDPRQGHQQGDR